MEEKPKEENQQYWGIFEEEKKKRFRPFLKCIASFLVFCMLYQDVISASGFNYTHLSKTTLQKTTQPPKKLDLSWIGNLFVGKVYADSDSSSLSSSSSSDLASSSSSSSNSNYSNSSPSSGSSSSSSYKPFDLGSAPSLSPSGPASSSGSSYSGDSLINSIISPSPSSGSSSSSSYKPFDLGSAPSLITTIPIQSSQVQTISFSPVTKDVQGAIGGVNTEPSYQSKTNPLSGNSSDNSIDNLRGLSFEYGEWAGKADSRFWDHTVVFREDSQLGTQAMIDPNKVLRGDKVSIGRNVSSSFQLSPHNNSDPITNNKPTEIYDHSEVRENPALQISGNGEISNLHVYGFGNKPQGSSAIEIGSDSKVKIDGLEIYGNYGIGLNNKGSVEINNSKIEVGEIIDKNIEGDKATIGILNENSGNIKIGKDNFVVGFYGINNAGEMTIERSNLIKGEIGILNENSGRIAIGIGNVIVGNFYGIRNNAGEITIADSNSIIGRSGEGKAGTGILNENFGRIEIGDHNKIIGELYCIHNNSGEITIGNSNNIKGGLFFPKEKDKTASIGILNENFGNIKIGDNNKISGVLYGIHNNSGEITIGNSNNIRVDISVPVEGTGILNEKYGNIKIGDRNEINGFLYGIHNNSGEITIGNSNIIGLLDPMEEESESAIENFGKIKIGDNNKISGVLFGIHNNSGEITIGNSNIIKGEILYPERFQGIGILNENSGKIKIGDKNEIIGDRNGIDNLGEITIGNLNTIKQGMEEKKISGPSIVNSGKFEMCNENKIEGEIGIFNKNSGKIKIGDKNEIIGDKYGIHNSSEITIGNLNTIKGNSNSGILNENSGKIKIGDKNEIIGDKYGIYNKKLGEITIGNSNNINGDKAGIHNEGFIKIGNLNEILGVVYGIYNNNFATVKLSNSNNIGSAIFGIYNKGEVYLGDLNDVFIRTTTSRDSYSIYNTGNGYIEIGDLNTFSKGVYGIYNNGFIEGGNFNEVSGKTYGIYNCDFGIIELKNANKVYARERPGELSYGIYNSQSGYVKLYDRNNIRGEFGIFNKDFGIVELKDSNNIIGHSVGIDNFDSGYIKLNDGNNISGKEDSINNRSSGIVKLGDLNTILNGINNFVPDTNISKKEDIEEIDIPAGFYYISPNFSGNMIIKDNKIDINHNIPIVELGDFNTISSTKKEGNVIFNSDGCIKFGNFNTIKGNFLDKGENFSFLRAIIGNNIDEIIIINNSNGYIKLGDFNNIYGERVEIINDGVSAKSAITIPIQGVSIINSNGIVEFGNFNNINLDKDTTTIKDTPFINGDFYIEPSFSIDSFPPCCIIVNTNFSGIKLGDFNNIKGDEIGIENRKGSTVILGNFNDIIGRIYGIRNVSEFRSEFSTSEPIISTIEIGDFNVITGKYGSGIVGEGDFGVIKLGEENNINEFDSSKFSKVISTIK